ncbi:MAG: PadR family transcriptional regulator [Oscillospiraceae bacterium]|nr:PadR family transcriptional regulator [Oscillospiraceae bacterium]
MSIASDLIRGHIDTIILAQLTAEDTYGYQINKAIRIKTDNQYELKEATLYSAFKRLEELGLIQSYWGDESTGARRRYYTITPEGREAYISLLSDWQNAKSLIDRLVKEDNREEKEVDYE